MKKSVLELRVGYSEVDAMGVVYYARYLEYMERARAKLLREEGVTYRGLEKKGLQFPVSESKVKYIKSARHDDLLSIEVTIAFIRGYSVKINHLIFNEKKELMAKGYTIHPFISIKNWELMEIPAELKAIFSAYLDQEVNI